MSVVLGSSYSEIPCRCSCCCCADGWSGLAAGIGGGPILLPFGGMLVNLAHGSEVRTAGMIGRGVEDQRNCYVVRCWIEVESRTNLETRRVDSCSATTALWEHAVTRPRGTCNLPAACDDSQTCTRPCGRVLRAPCMHMCVSRWYSRHVISRRRRSPPTVVSSTTVFRTSLKHSLPRQAC